MVPYFTLYGALSVLALGWRYIKGSIYRKILLWIFFLILTTFIGLRFEVGGDWRAYLNYNLSFTSSGLDSGPDIRDWGYVALNWVSVHWFGGIYLVNFVCAFISVSALFYFATRFYNPPLAITVALPYLIFVVNTGYTRQGVAIAFGMLAVLAVSDRRVRSFLLYVTLATMFHRTAVVLFVLAPALFAELPLRRGVIKVGAIWAFGAFLTVMLFWDNAGSLLRQYVIATGDTASAVAKQFSADVVFEGVGSEDASELTRPQENIHPAGAEVARSTKEVPKDAADGLYSAGAVVRILQSVVAALGFVVIARRVKLAASTVWLWSIVSSMVLALFLLAFFRSTLADRLALFFIPLQLFVFSTLPSTFSQTLERVLMLIILLGGGASLWVWMTYGSHSHRWLPYQNVLQQWL